ncbi:hypothetical protein Cni_G02344 [Canna indica]|uniref:Glutathione S-transferase n=1 Tax=Canna indica TaxID=4628 RepID=A0AAQ3JR52_9LILI|nr:hypothetical protein Cni_G02344 [Canna indica]
MGEEVKVLRTWGSTFCYRVELALKLKGVAYEKVEEDLSNKSPLLLGYNPVHKKVPVFLHNGKPIAESLVILEYIEDTWKENPILPKDPYERAMARFWARFIDDKCIVALWMSCRTEGEAQKNFMEQAKESLQILEKELKGALGGVERGCVGRERIIGVDDDDGSDADVVASNDGGGGGAGAPRGERLKANGPAPCGCNNALCVGCCANVIYTAVADSRHMHLCVSIKLMLRRITSPLGHQLSICGH